MCFWNLACNLEPNYVRSYGNNMQPDSILAVNRTRPELHTMVTTMVTTMMATMLPTSVTTMVATMVATMVTTMVVTMVTTFNVRSNSRVAVATIASCG